MSKRFLLFLALLAVMAFGPGSAGAVLVNFDNIAAGTNIDGVDLNGVVITSQDSSSYVYLGDAYGMGFRSWPNGLTNSGFLINNPLTFTFDVPRGFVQFTGGDAGGDQDRFTVDAYDVNNNLLSHLDTGVFGGNPIDPNNIMVDFRTITFDNALYGTGHIKRMVVTAYSVNGPGIGIDDLNFCQPAPIPGSLMLFGSALLGLVGLRRKA